MLRTIGFTTRKATTEIGTNPPTNEEAMMKHTKGRRYHGQLHLSFTLFFCVLFSCMSVTAFLTYIWAKVAVVQTQEAHVLDPSHPKSDFFLAYKESFGLFDDIPNQSWKLMKERVRNRQNHLFPDPHWTDALFPPRWYQDNWEPDFSCQHERRVGGMGDGPKWVCNPHRILQMSRKNKRKCLIYSVGSNGDFSFEKGLYELFSREKSPPSCEIHVFDPKDYSASVPNDIKSMLHFHPWGIVGEASVSTNFKSLKETVEVLGHKGEILDIFKIDCEKCEWETFDDWFSVGLDIRQILVEVHGSPDTANDFFETIQEMGYVTFHKEPNTKHSLGSCVEYAFLKLDSSFFRSKK